MAAADTAFEEYVKQLLINHKGTRIYRFEYQGQYFWLKQPEQLHGIWKLLKPHPKMSFQKEIQTLQYFASVNAPVPKLILYDKDFLVLNDAGRSAIAWIEDLTVLDSLKHTILSDCIKALIALHQKDLIHGRPALRDMTWRDGKVKFLDFEAHVYRKQKLTWDKARDILIFLHGVCRSKTISNQEVQQIIQLYIELGNVSVWHLMCETLRKYRFIYYLLLPFKPIAKTDLIAIYRLFENMSTQLKEGK
ncbi:protein kinase family protein [Pasteurella oralis]|uniref:Protein kinase family protein n=1 Tax=Pasteurella oralis TaxID=1071947 RepID=A0ABW4NUG1_9PAST